MFSHNMDSLGYQSFKGVNWALDLSLYLGDVIKGLLLVLGPFFNPVLGLRTYYFKPHQLPPEPLAKAGVGKGCIPYDIDFLLIYWDLLINIVSLN